MKRLLMIVLLLVVSCTPEPTIHVNYNEVISNVSCNCTLRYDNNYQYQQYEYHYDCYNGTMNVSFEAIGYGESEVRLYSDCLEVTFP
jgi:hypothetical protein